MKELVDRIDQILEDVPDKYLKGLGKKSKEARSKEISRRAKEPSGDSKSYRPFKTDKDKSGKQISTKKSSYTKKAHKKFGKENLGSVAKAAKASGISKSVLDKVYARGLAAWRTGHRPGATSHQWAMARVYSFITKGKTWSTADADLAKKVKK